MRCFGTCGSKGITNSGPLVSPARRYTLSAMTLELVDEALRTMMALDSVRIDCTTTFDGEVMGVVRRTMTNTLTIVGEDVHQRGDIDQGGEVAGHVRAILGEPREWLHCGGVEYVRDPRNGDWLKEIPEAEQYWVSSGSSASFSVEQSSEDVAEGRAPLSEEEYKRRYLLFGTEPSRMQDYRLVGTDDVDGRSLAHIRGEYFDGGALDHMPSPENFAKHATMPPEALENYKKLYANFPDRRRGTLDMWIDEVTHFIHRLLWIDQRLRDDRAVETHEGTRVYSLFNAAELPDPLPG